MLTSTIWRILAPAYYAIRHAGSYEGIDPMQGWEMAREWALGEKAASRDYSWSGTPPFPSPPLADGAAAP